MTILAIISLSIIAAAPGKDAFTGLASIQPGSRLIASSTGVAIYRTDYPDGNSDFVQVVDLSLGASVELLHGEIINKRSGQGVYGGSDPEIWRQPLWQAWNDFSSSSEVAFCITNGQFFSSTKENPTTLAFPLKKDSYIVSDGYDIDKYPDKQLLLEIWKDRADIIPLTQADLHLSSAPNIVAGLAEDAGKHPEYPTGRTFVGVGDGDNDGRYEVMLIFNSKIATQPHAADVLRNFGADKVIMLDGGDSTQLICQDELYVASTSGREIPQTLAVTSGPRPLVFCDRDLWMLVTSGLIPGHQYKVVLENSASLDPVKAYLSNSWSKSGASYWEGELRGNGSTIVYFTATSAEGGNAGQLYLRLESGTQAQACVETTVLDVTPCTAIYRVQRSDALPSIARRYVTTVWNIAHTNDISNPNLIFPGQILCIP